MCGIRAPALVLPIVLLLAAPGTKTIAAAMSGAMSAAMSDPPPAPPPDPWATVRGCQAVLARFAICSADKRFRAHRDRWVAAPAPQAATAGKASPAVITQRLKSWVKADGRRAQCATWARRAGAPEHIAEGTPLAQVAAQGRAVPCEAFARKLDEDGWLPAALVDARID
jgi:hypothetical protein